MSLGKAPKILIRTLLRVNSKEIFTAAFVGHAQNPVHLLTYLLNIAASDLWSGEVVRILADLCGGLSAPNRCSTAPYRRRRRPRGRRSSPLLRNIRWRHRCLSTKWRTSNLCFALDCDLWARTVLMTSRKGWRPTASYWWSVTHWPGSSQLTPTR